MEIFDLELTIRWRRRARKLAISSRPSARNADWEHTTSRKVKIQLEFTAFGFISGAWWSRGELARCAAAPGGRCRPCSPSTARDQLQTNCKAVSAYLMKEPHVHGQAIRLELAAAVGALRHRVAVVVTCLLVVRTNVRNATRGTIF